MILVKLGGSVITNKQKPLSVRKARIRNLAKVLNQIVNNKTPIIIVHGGGSYGHYWSTKYDMHTKEQRYDLGGVAIVKKSMIDLDQIILNILLKEGVKPYCVAPSTFMSKGAKPIPERIIEMKNIAKSGMTPVTFGDALWYGTHDKTYILSGDKIMSHLAEVLKPDLCIFALDEDGLYSDMSTKHMIKEVIVPKRGKIKMISAYQNSGTMDVTGGMSRKVQEATKIARMGVDVLLINGNKPHRIAQASQKNPSFNGTIFKTIRTQKEEETPNNY